MTETQEISVMTALRNQTRTAHEELDQYLTNLGLFKDVELYKKFVLLQYFIHRDALELYEHAELGTIIPGLEGRNRFEKVKEDLKDLGVAIPETEHSPLNLETVSQAAGYLYVVEGSKLGASHLIRRVEKIGLSESYGARHMAADEEGRGNSWRAFQSALNEGNFDLPTVVESADQAFKRILSYARQVTA